MMSFRVSPDTRDYSFINSDAVVDMDESTECDEWLSTGNLCMCPCRDQSCDWCNTGLFVHVDCSNCPNVNFKNLHF